MKTKIYIGSGPQKFDEKSFFNTLQGFTTYWDYTPNNEFVSQKLTNIITLEKIHLKCDCIEWTVVEYVRKPILFSFV